MSENWVRACAVNDIEEEDVVRFDHNGQTFAIYRLADGNFYASDGLCTHGRVHLCGGFVNGNIIECPKHNGRFDITCGKAVGHPARIDLKMYPVKVQDGAVYVQIG